ncbi:MAG: LacI family DNA-binding transcriptional regulator, partial [Phycisphaeraceae bacterium]|nr:LacI family DNA-binding transcriptional regulator [Phycisphaeraceae bacterium]
MSRSAPTLEQIAVSCHLSAMTVSRALRSDPGISETTRLKVVAAAKRMGYRPRVKAGRPRRSRDAATAIRPSVAVVFATDGVPSTFFFSHTLAALEGQLSQRGYICRVLALPGGQYERFLAVVENLREGRDQAILLVGAMPPRQLQSLIDLNPPLILVDHTGDPRTTGDYDAIAFDNTEAARLAVKHLAGLGRRRIALLSGIADHYFSRDIEHGYHDMLALLDLPLDCTLLWRGNFDPRQARQIVLDQIEAGTSFDAVV